MDTMIKTAIRRTIVMPGYRVFSPVNTGVSFDSQWDDCYSNFRNYLLQNPHKKPFIVNVFVDAAHSDEFTTYEKKVKTSFLAYNIPISVVTQSPEQPLSVIMEVGFVDERETNVSYGRTCGTAYCKLSNDHYSEYWFAGIRSDDHVDISQAAQITFTKLQSIFEKLQLSFNEIVRQWNTVEKIVGFCTLENRQRQNYQLFNEARHESYSKFLTDPGFPAATGIGGNAGGVNINCLAIPKTENIRVISIGSPIQTDSYKYGQKVLKGAPDKNRSYNQVPQFERAKLICDGKSSRLLISGTAAIIGQDTIGIGDVHKQTQVTIDNIEMLASAENMKTHFPQLRILPEKYAYVRVYVKNKTDISIVRQICAERFGNVPLTIVQADICREDLLVEIEAEKTST